jgi:pimeloyl-ACP methyl ester carboxylesterase
MPALNVRGTDHYYEWVTETSSTEPTGKPVLVFIHGWAGSARYWEATARALTPEFDCLLYDLRGFGRSQLPRPIPQDVAALGYELEGYADDLALLLEGLGLERVYLNAHSTGGSIAVLFLNRYPERAVKLILTCNGVFEYDETSFAAFHKFGGYVVKFRPAWLVNIPWVDQLFMARFLHRSIPSHAKRAFLEDFLTADYEAALGTIYTAVSEKAAHEMPREFSALKIPTLLISGQYDQIIPAKMGQQAAALNDRCIQFIEMSKTSHFPMLEDPEVYLNHVQAFLKSKSA